MFACVRILLLIGLLLSFGPALAAWEEAYDTGDWALCVVADPVQQRVYAGLYGGLAIYDAMADTWVSLHGSPAVDAVLDFLWHPEQPGLLVMARGLDGAPAHIDRSLDGGFTATTVYTLPDEVYIADLERDPTTPDRLYAATYTFGSAHGGMVLRSLTAGASWQIIEQSAVADRYCLAVDGVGQLYRGGEDGIWVSADGGESWMSAQGDLPAGRIYCLRAMPDGSAGHLFAGIGLGLYESLDAGAHWVSILTQTEMHPTDLVIHPTMPATMAVHTLTAIGPADNVLLSRNGGQDWAYTNYFMIAMDWGAYAGMDILPMQNRIYATMQDWIYTYDLGATAVAPAPAAGLRLAAFPNPFNPSTQIKLEAPAAGAISLRILDSAGRLQRTLLNRVPHAGGELRVAWDGCDDAGRRLPSGVYHYLLEAGGERAAGKLTLLK
jgi:hypothetical protein